MVSVDRVRERLVASQLFAPQGVDDLVARWRQATGILDPAAGEAFLRWLVEQKALTPFQAEAIEVGDCGRFMLGPYRIFHRIAAGRLGTVYQAVHEQLGQPVSLKVFPLWLKEDREKVARMHREIRVAVELDHPNVVRSFHIGRFGDVYYMAFEDLEGQTLAEMLDRHGPLPYPRACRLVREVARGLAYLHQKGLVHRDIQPASIWVTPQGTPKLVEFGAVRDALGEMLVPSGGTRVTDSKSVVGSADYMPPEQARDPHAADHRSDIYSLGCTFYHCLAGCKPFATHNPVKLATLHATTMPAPLTRLVPGLPAPLCDVVNSMIAKSPDARFQTAEDVAWALEPYVAPPVAAPAPPVAVAPEYRGWLREASREAAGAGLPKLAGFLAWLADPEDPAARRSP